MTSAYLSLSDRQKMFIEPLNYIQYRQDREITSSPANWRELERKRDRRRGGVQTTEMQGLNLCRYSAMLVSYTQINRSEEICRSPLRLLFLTILIPKIRLIQTLCYETNFAMAFHLICKTITAFLLIIIIAFF